MRTRADGLPSKADAQAARDLAKQERELRNELGQANEKGNQGPKATDNKGVEELAKKQQRARRPSRCPRERGRQAR